jgi:hypothetical protein
MPKCPKCNTNNPDDSKFCGDCGGNLSHKENKEEKTHYPKSSKKGLWITLIVIILSIGLLSGLLVPYKVVTKTEQVPYQTTEKYTVKEPYSGSETFTEEVPYQDQECNTVNYDYTKTNEQFIGSIAEGGQCTEEKKGPNPNCIIAKNIFIKNLDSKAGDFYATCIYSNSEKFKTQSVRIEPLSEESVQCSNNYGVGETLYLSRVEIVPPSKEECTTVTNFKTVDRQKSTTEYKDVEKTRQATKMRTDTVSIQVNWLLGIKLPWHKEWKQEGNQE